MTTVDDPRTHAREIAATVRETGAKLVCIDFDATFVSIHTGGAWHRSPEELRPHVRALFLALVPLLVDAHIHVAVVTFSPQVDLIRAVLQLCFSSDVIDSLIVRCDDPSWRLDKSERIEFLPVWMVSSMHFDRAFKLAYVISAARQASQARGELIRNRDTILIDDDEQNIRIAIDNGITGIYYEPQGAEPRELCRRIRKLHVPALPVALSSTAPTTTQGPLATPVKLPLHQTPCKRKTVRLLQTPEAPPRTSSRGPPSVRLHGTPVIASMPRSKKFSLCTPSPVMKLKCTVTRPKKAARARHCPRNIEEDLHDLHLLQPAGPAPPTSAPGRMQRSRSSPPPLPFLSTSPQSPVRRVSSFRSFLDAAEDVEA